MVGITYVYIDMDLGFMGPFFFFFCYTHLYCFVGCWSVIGDQLFWGVFCACVVCFCICTCSVQLSMFHVERCSRNMLIIVNIIVKLF